MPRRGSRLCRSKRKVTDSSLTTSSVASPTSLITIQEYPGYQPEIKRKKINENSNSTEVPETSPGSSRSCKLQNKVGEQSDERELLDQKVIVDDDMDNCNEIPTLVVEILLERVDDVDLLKTCRLVNKYWSDLACTALQKNSVIKLKDGRVHDEECDSRLNDFLLSQVKRSTPNPFKNFHISTFGFNKYQFYNLVLREQFVTTKLTINIRDKVSVQRLNEFLKAKRELTNVDLKIISLHHGDSLKIFKDVRLPFLNSLIIEASKKSAGSNFTHEELLFKALQDSSLQYLTLQNITCCMVPMLKLNLFRLVKLHLDISAIDSLLLPLEFWDVLANLQLPLLQNLIFYDRQRNEDQVEKLKLFLSNVSSTLLELKCNDLARHSNIMFPELLNLSMSCPPDVPNFFVDERFPSLQSLTIRIHEDVTEYIKFETDVLHPMKNVRLLDICIDGNIMRAVFQVGIMNFARKFPNVEKFGINEHIRMSPAYFLRMYSAFPNLKDLSIKGQIDFATLAGTSKDKVAKSLRMGKLNTDATRKTSIFDFTELKSLTLNIIIEEDTLLHCLALLTKLKYLEFSLRTNYHGIGETIPTQVFGDSLKHFKKMRIDWVPQDILKKLQDALPDCEVTRGMENHTGGRIHFICTVD